MSYHIELIKNLLNYIDLYEEHAANANIEEFSLFLKDRVFGSKKYRNTTSIEKGDQPNYRNYAEVEFSIGLTTLFRYAKIYIKKAFTGSSIKTLDEFGFLSTLFREGNLLKSELIQKHLLEISSGSEILKRLIKQGLIDEFDDKQDHRAKRVLLTEQGRKEVLVAFEQMHKVSEIIIGTLTEQELKDTLAVFQKLTNFHRHIHENDKNTELDALHTKYIETEMS
ncbi:MAG: winged helix-turn-helix transcriptional regulator [Bacteroidales bacterium]|nr:winged helix-turn-helix transcriptional regulator [Bacteroidales bacterium]